jgi:hypothetical protein
LPEWTEKALEALGNYETSSTLPILSVSNIPATSTSRIPSYRKISLQELFNYPPAGIPSRDLAFYWSGGIHRLEEEEKELSEEHDQVHE